MAVLILFVFAFIVLAIGVPIGIAFIVGILSAGIVDPVAKVSLIAQNLFSGYESIPLVAIPCFILAGSIMEIGGLSKRLVNIAEILVGKMTGGLGAVTVLACLFFGAISGSAPATVAAIGGIMIPYMVKSGYDKAYSTGLSAVAGGLGIIVPPSIPFIIYGFINLVSIGDLFIAGIIPALIIAVFLIIVSYITAKKRGYKAVHNKVPFKQLVKMIVNAIPALLMPLIILGGIYGGVFTPTEAAVVAIIYGLIIGIFVYKEIKPKTIIKILYDNSDFIGGLMLTLAPAAALAAVLALYGVPNMVLQLLLSVSSSQIVILLIINLILLIAGMVMDPIAAIIILSPIFLPAVVQYGIDPVHFGVIFVVNLAIGFVTPPVAANLFVASSMTGVPVEKITKPALPFIGALFVALMLITFIPQISMVLVNLF